MLSVTPPASAVRLVVGAIPVTLLVALISLALPRDRRDYVLQLAAVVVQLVRAITAYPRTQR